MVIVETCEECTRCGLSACYSEYQTFANTETINCLACGFVVSLENEVEQPVEVQAIGAFSKTEGGNGLGCIGSIYPEDSIEELLEDPQVTYIGVWENDALRMLRGNLCAVLKSGESDGE